MIVIIFMISVVIENYVGYKKEYYSIWEVVTSSIVTLIYVLALIFMFKI